MQSCTLRRASQISSSETVIVVGQKDVTPFVSRKEAIVSQRFARRVARVGAAAAVNVQIDKAGHKQAARAVCRVPAVKRGADPADSRSLRLQIGPHKIESPVKEQSIFVNQTARLLTDPTCRTGR